MTEHDIAAVAPTSLQDLEDRLATPAPQPVCLRHGARWLILRLSTDNPFYVLSALLVLLGLWTSFGAQARPEQTWALMTGLAGYTLLLALPACSLVRYGGVWEDVRTVLLLVVLMFLATSVTFDETLGRDPVLGLACSFGGLAFALLLSEGGLRAMRLSLPWGFKTPYYLALCLFFGYPAALVPLLDQPRSAGLEWALFGFGLAAAAVALTLIPAARKGADYVRENGSPWPWPYYPWALFVFLGLGAAARSFLICWSMQHVARMGASEPLIFGPYFLAPLTMAVGAVLIAASPRQRSSEVRAAGLLAPALAVVLSGIGHRQEPLYQGFLDEFTATLGGTPLYLALIGAMAFHVVATLRRVRGAVVWLTPGLLALSVIGPEARSFAEMTAPRPGPIVVLALWQIALAALSWRRERGRLLAAAGLMGLAILIGPGPLNLRAGVAFHLALATLFTLGWAFDDEFGRRLRGLASAMAAAAGLAVVVMGEVRPGAAPAWVVDQYPPSLALALAGLGYLSRDRLAVAAGGLVLAGWCGAMGWGAYEALREQVRGLDAIVMGLVLLAMAQLISLAKAGLLPEPLSRRKPRADGLSE